MRLGLFASSCCRLLLRPLRVRPTTRDFGNLGGLWKVSQHVRRHRRNRVLQEHGVGQYRSKTRLRLGVRAPQTQGKQRRQRTVSAAQTRMRAPLCTTLAPRARNCGAAVAPGARLSNSGSASSCDEARKRITVAAHARRTNESSEMMPCALRLRLNTAARAASALVLTFSRKRTRFCILRMCVCGCGAAGASSPPALAFGCFRFSLETRASMRARRFAIVPQRSVW